MNILKILSASFFTFFSLILVTPVFAVEAPPSTGTPSQEMIIIADVNVREAEITSQNGKTINISFDISNGENVQSGVKYSVRLIKDTLKTQTTVDEYVFPETLSLGANTTIKKDIIYTAPANLGGEYTVMVSLNNYSGLGLGLGIAGKVKLTSSPDSLEIIQDSCYSLIVGDKTNTKYKINQGIKISPLQSIRLNCTVVNNSKTDISVFPSYQTFYRTLFGDIVEDKGGDVTPISFKAGQKKLVSITLPKALNPQAYSLKMTFGSDKIFSNSVVIKYFITGLNATIQNLSLDKDSYRNNDIAKISFVWNSTYDTKVSSLPIVTLFAQINNDKQKECIAPVEKVLTEVGLIEISAPIIANCENLQATVVLKDENGNILDQKNLSFEPKMEASGSSTFFSKNNLILITFGILLVAGIAIYFINLKKKQNETSN